MSLYDSITSMPGIGKVRAEKLEKLGITTVRDMIYYFPHSVEDRRITKKITELSDGDVTCIRAMVSSSPTARHFKKNFAVYTVPLRDDTAAAYAVFYNNAYVMNNFKTGSFYNFYGKVSVKGSRREIITPVYESSASPSVTDTIVPVYRTPSAISQKVMVSCIKKCLDTAGNSIEDFLPKALCEKYHLCRADYAIRNIHFPVDFNAYESARSRLAFEELFLLQLGLRLKKAGASRASVAPFTVTDVSPLFKLLPYEMTSAQKRVLGEIQNDLSSGTPMNRLVQGDVGSGKTAVALAALYLCAVNGFQGALMAPTELLARQHYEYISPLMEKLGFKTVLLVGSMTAKEKRRVSDELACGLAHIAVGTHALFQQSVTFKALRLVVTDEQHRFGVLQRSALVSKGENAHTLVMTATPIPRTLALVIYGDLDVSVIDELPPGRQKVDTFCVGEGLRQRMYNFIKKEALLRHKTYIVCPMVEENEALELASAVKYADNLRQNVFPDLKIGLVHGKMAASEKEAVMNGFAFGDTDILVSTTVIEVGVNVPSATLMIIENAERFGLSQLHQLRGRVGRGKDKSYCIMMLGSVDEDIKKRMSIMTQTNDGFKISETDLEMRGPGEFFGTRQHGLPPLKISSLMDMETLKRSSEAVNELLSEDPDLEKEENALLKARVKDLFSGIEDFTA